MVLDLQSFKIELVPHEVPSFYFNMSLDEGRVMVLPFVTLTLATADSGPECAGLNPLSRTIQGNDPGTTACPPSARAGIG